MLTGILFIALIAVLAYTYLRKPTYMENPPLVSTMAQHANLPDQVLAIDMDIHDNRTINEGDVAKGDAPLIVLIPNTQQEPRFIKDFNELAALDTTNDSQIDQLDDAYKYLYLAYLQQDGSFKYVLLSDAGVYALFLDQSHLAHVNEVITTSTIKIAGTALLADNSRRPIVPVLIGVKVLNKLHRLEQ